MKISAIIAEYNPFHNGHKYLIEQAKKNSDAVICVMSGSFVQRGDVAVFDKWTRAEAALLNGADLILELPVVFSASTAERFACGAVELISSLNCIESLYFGSENGDIETLKKAGLLLYNETSEISSDIKKYLSKGYSFPKARQYAYNGKISSDILTSPNNILALEYIKAIYSLKSSVKPYTIQRTGTEYHSLDTKEEYASATALRSYIYNNKDYYEYIPQNLINLYKTSDIYSLSEINNVILYLLRKSETNELSEINDVTEGLENRLKEFSKKTHNIYSLIDSVATKRYPKTRIMRILISLLLGIKKEMIYDNISYIRVLGFTDTGRDIIKQIKKSSELPVIIKTADFKDNQIMFQKDILATDTAALCSLTANKKTGGKDYTTPPVYISSK